MSIYLMLLEFFRVDKLPTPEEIAFFLELEMMKDIKIVNKAELGCKEVKWAIFGTGYSSRHIYKVGKTLVKTLKGLNVLNC